MDFDRKDGSSYLDGVPIRIASRFCPPRPVTLPLAFDATLPSDLLNQQYDFALEKQVLEFEQRRLAESEASKAREADRNVASKIESMSNISHEDNVNRASNTQLEPSGASNNNQNQPSWLSNSILQPQHEKQLSSQRTQRDEQLDSCKKINLSDFENDSSSPFDYMELQTINDLEELSSVFQGINNRQFTRHNEQSEEKNENSLSQSEGSLSRNEPGGNVSKSISFPLPQNADSCYSEGNSDTLQSLTTLKTVPVVPSSNNDTRLCFSYPSVSGSVTGVATSNTSIDTNYPGTSWSYSALSRVPYTTFKMSSGNTSENSQFSTTLLRGSKSYSDLPNLAERKENSVPMQDRSLTPPYKLPSSEVNETSIKLFVNSAYSQHSFNNDISSNGILDGTVVPATAFELPDPYEELEDNARQIVDSITDMGFPQAQVARTVKHLGTDEKKVVEHLCQIQILEESGYDSLEAEAALHLHDYKQDQAKTFLDLVNQFQDLGFEKTAIKKALVQNKNDWNKTIDALLP